MLLIQELLAPVFPALKTKMNSQTGRFDEKLEQFNVHVTANAPPTWPLN